MRSRVYYSKCLYANIYERKRNKLSQQSNTSFFLTWKRWFLSQLPSSLWFEKKKPEPYDLKRKDTTVCFVHSKNIVFHIFICSSEDKLTKHRRTEARENIPWKWLCCCRSDWFAQEGLPRGAPTDAFCGEVSASRDSNKGQNTETLLSEAVTLLGVWGGGRGNFTVKHACAFPLFMLPASDITKVTLFCNGGKKKKKKVNYQQLAAIDKTQKGAADLVLNPTKASASFK